MDKVLFDFPLWEEVINGDIRLVRAKLEAVVATSMARETLKSDNPKRTTEEKPKIEKSES